LQKAKSPKKGFFISAPQELTSFEMRKKYNPKSKPKFLRASKAIKEKILRPDIARRRKEFFEGKVAYYINLAKYLRKKAKLEVLVKAQSIVTGEADADSEANQKLQRLQKPKLPIFSVIIPEYKMRELCKAGFKILRDMEAKARKSIKEEFIKKSKIELALQQAELQYSIQVKGEDKALMDRFGTVFVGPIVDFWSTVQHEEEEEEEKAEPRKKAEEKSMRTDADKAFVEDIVEFWKKFEADKKQLEAINNALAADDDNADEPTRKKKKKKKKSKRKKKS
jgi:hypothetical protein